jgi:hypothetical protein
MKTKIIALISVILLVSCSPTTALTPVENNALSLTQTLEMPTPTNSPELPEAFLQSNGLSVQEVELKAYPDSESRSFVPVKGSEFEILAKHQKEREQNVVVRGFESRETWLKNKRIVAKEIFPKSNQDFARIIVVSEDNAEIFRLVIENPVPTYPSLLGLWVYKDEWFIETTRSNKTGEYPYAVGDIFQTGQSLNMLYGYDESFGFQLLAGKPFYFYKKDGKIRASYDGQDMLVQYDELPHYLCCSAGGINPIKSENMVSFFGKKGNKWYYVEIGSFTQ